MQNLYKIAALSYLFSFFCAEIIAQKRFSISGILPERFDGVEINLSSDNTAFRLLNTKAQKGQFHFSGEIKEEYDHVKLSIKRDNEYLGGAAFFIKSGEMKIEFLSLKDKSPQNHIRYFNVPFIKEQQKYDALLQPIQDSIIFVFNLLNAVKKGYRSEYNKDSLVEVIKSLRAETISRKQKFIKKNRNNYLGFYLFNTEIINNVTDNMDIHPDTLMSDYTAFDRYLRETELGRSVEAYISKKKSLLINEILPNFSFSTSKFEQYDLSSFRKKKYALLCFWDSWCSPCIRSIPLLKKLGKEYEEKGLQMISISIDNDEVKWLNSLKRHDLPWLQTCDLPAYVKGPRVRSLYDINYIPQYFLIDKEGRLIYHNNQLKDSDEYNILQKMLENLLR